MATRRTTLDCSPTAYFHWGLGVAGFGVGVPSRVSPSGGGLLGGGRRLQRPDWATRWGCGGGDLQSRPGIGVGGTAHLETTCPSPPCTLVDFGGEMARKLTR